MTPDQVRQIIRQELAFLIGTDRLTFKENIQIFDNRNIQLGRTTGTQIGTAADQKLAFYGFTPIVQQAAISNPAGGGTAGVDNPARTAIVSILTAIHNIGITA